ncbi:MAG: response regulator [Candidatus Syntrophopropionicum ammoniitolerans]
MANNLNTTTNGFNGLNIAEQVGSRAKPNGSLKILIIDDIEDLAQIMCELVCLLGHEATFAYNGTDGIAIAKEFRPQVIICDIGLPGLSGYEVADLIRKIPNYRMRFWLPCRAMLGRRILNAQKMPALPGI